MEEVTIKQGERPFRFGFVLGRFQQLHLGHEKMIDLGLRLCDNLLVLVGSAQERGTKRNPFPAELRIEMLLEVFGERAIVEPLPDYTNENDHSHAWGRYLLEAARAAGRARGLPPLDLMLTGDDEERERWFPPEELAALARVVLPRSAVPIRATDLRQAMLADDRAAWERGVNERLHRYYDDLRAQLLAVYRQEPEAGGAPSGK
ncbi:hypothetical protein J19TS2_47730 [Cohnella xylanilytica]|uniref:Adenylyltransferase/cytidyltransferase family protein n=1 Tax=Cohnella xylanilytica TaxID=557555 RepID=A0A841TYP8_9BACL|nr:adenylyltransferase/cytidyltransferase family protein [Cohnella xylanilytica]MBB6693677.1 adenylyltransferase/cytidyltransferase family protein [Cohnella xylanilytica]GIO15218.1 hypothetical protein J19TS2_47730 [Cohnella xylanilytica]